TIFSDTDQKTWSSAKTACKEKGMELASVENEEEEMELEAILKSCGYNLGFVWIGASDIESEGEFIWSSSGRPLSYTNWDPHNTGGTDQNCLAAGWASDYYKWADRPCAELHTYVCEY
ncbi:C-type lectin domain-containing protein, partial [Pseudophaeobacter profundi]|uniref:C-type lectin domain-containing protein n=1 Tax=Pseudophaeobacter profundi TaxID=3034152 RepID=UPI00242C61F9